MRNSLCEKMGAHRFQNSSAQGARFFGNGETIFFPAPGIDIPDLVAGRHSDAFANAAAQHAVDGRRHRNAAHPAHHVALPYRVADAQAILHRTRNPGPKHAFAIVAADISWYAGIGFGFAFVIQTGQVVAALGFDHPVGVSTGAESRSQRDDQRRFIDDGSQVAFGNYRVYTYLRTATLQRLPSRIYHDRQHAVPPDGLDRVGMIGAAGGDALNPLFAIVHRLAERHGAAYGQRGGCFQHEDAAESRPVQARRHTGGHFSAALDDDDAGIGGVHDFFSSPKSRYRKAHMAQPHVNFREELERFSPGIIALLGGGGKTSLLLALGRSFAENGGKALGVTTTRLQRPASEDAVSFLLQSDPAAIRFSGPGFVLAARPA